MRIALVLVVTAACANDPSAPMGDDDDAVDAVASVDAPLGGGGVVGECVKTQERIATHLNGDTTREARYAVRLDDAADGSAWLRMCDFQIYGTDAFRIPCPEGATCTGTLVSYIDGCNVTTGFREVAGEKFVECGWEQQRTGSDPMMFGGHWTSVTIHD